MRRMLLNVRVLAGLQTRTKRWMRFWRWGRCVLAGRDRMRSVCWKGGLRGVSVRASWGVLTLVVVECGLCGHADEAVLV